MSTETFSYDVFLSHSSKDGMVVRELAERLQRDGLRVWFHEWAIQPGDSIHSKIEEGLEQSRVLVLCMSANAFGADWSRLEAGTFLFRDPLNKERRFIPLRLDDAPIKGSLAQFLYINWRPADREQEYAKLLDACQQKGPSVKADGQSHNQTQLPHRGTDGSNYTGPSDTEVRFRSKTAIVRKLVLEALSDEDITGLCQDHFASVHGEFSSGMTRLQKVGRLIEHCVRRNGLVGLVALIREINPTKYAELGVELEQ